LSAEVLVNFLRAIDEREKAGHVLEDTLVGIEKSEIVEAYIEDERAQVTVKFVSEQINVVRDSEGQIASGNPNEVINVVDLWTFARDIRSTDPNWALVATHSLD
jgi:predicted lipid-binding transport protein (Tim44 family)